MKQYFKIGEISKLYHIGQDSLRYYENLGILQPHRGENNYRLYQLEDIWKLNVIRELRELGFSMERIGAYLENRTVEETKNILREELDIIDAKMEKLRQLKQSTKERMETIETCTRQEFDVVQEIILPARKCRSMESNYKTDEEMDVLIKQLVNLNPERLYIIGSNRIGSVITLEDAKVGKYRSYSKVFMVDDEGEDIIEGGRYLTLRYHGLTKENEKYLPMLLKYVEEHGYQMISDVYEILWIDIHTSKDVKEHVNELQVRVE